RPPGDGAQGLGEGDRLQPSLAKERRGQALHPVREGVSEPTLVAQPRVVDVVVVAGQMANHLPPAQVDPEVAAAGTVGADAVARLEAEGPGGEAIVSRGE